MRKLLFDRRWSVSLAGMLLACSAAPDLGIAQLPPAIMADRYLVQAERELVSGDAAAAVETLNRIVTLQAEEALDIPDEVWFRRAQAAHGAGLHDLAVQSAVRYLELTGQDGEHYGDTLTLYDAAELAHEEAERLAALQPGDTYSDALNSGGRGPELVLIGPGSFLMGCVSGLDCAIDGEDIREVRISQPFMLSKYEVTFEQWDACVDAGGCNGYRPNDLGWGRGRRPVIFIDPEDAQSYVTWLSAETGQEYRLPSAAEWEFAARAGSMTKYSWGNEIGFNRANCEECGSQWDTSTTAPVGSFAPNAWGLYDMHGNVWEWVAGSTLRGGSWSVSAWNLRSARNTNNYGVIWGSATLGFRVARTLGP